MNFCGLNLWQLGRQWGNTPHLPCGSTAGSLFLQTVFFKSTVKSSQRVFLSAVKWQIGRNKGHMNTLYEKYILFMTTQSIVRNTNASTTNKAYLNCALSTMYDHLSIYIIQMIDCLLIDCDTYYKRCRIVSWITIMGMLKTVNTLKLH